MTSRKRPRTIYARSSAIHSGKWGESQVRRYQWVLNDKLDSIVRGEVVARSLFENLPDVAVTRCQRHYVFYLADNRPRPLIIAVFHTVWATRCGSSAVWPTSGRPSWSFSSTCIDCVSMARFGCRARMLGGENVSTYIDRDPSDLPCMSAVGRAAALLHREADPAGVWMNICAWTRESRRSLDFGTL